MSEILCFMKWRTRRILSRIIMKKSSLGMEYCGWDQTKSRPMGMPDSRDALFFLFKEWYSCHQTRRKTIIWVGETKHRPDGRQDSWLGLLPFIFLYIYTTIYCRYRREREVFKTHVIVSQREKSYVPICNHANYLCINLSVHKFPSVLRCRTRIKRDSLLSSVYCTSASFWFCPSTTTTVL